MYPHSIRLRGPWNFDFLRDKQAGTVTMPAVLPAPKNGLARFTRGFNWMAKLEADEIVYLYIQGAIGEASVSLNGTPLGERRGVWGTTRLNVTRHLAGRNHLVMVTDTPTTDPETQVMEGLAGRAGIWGDVFLSVELRGVDVASPTIDSVVSPNGGRLVLNGSVSLSKSIAGAHAVFASLTLDGAPIAEQKIQPPIGNSKQSTIRLEAENLPVEAWKPRKLGRPSLHDLTFELRAGGVTLHTHTYQIGFRVPENQPLDCLGKDAAIGEIGPDRTLAPNTGEALTTPFQDWYIGQFDAVHVRGHFASNDFYSLCDRAGLPVIQDIPTASIQQCFESHETVRETVRRLSVHPCIAEWRLTMPDAQIYELFRDIIPLRT